MRSPTNAEKVRSLMDGIGRRATGPGRVYLVGGATAVLIGWRETTVDVDLKLEPEPPGVFEAIAVLKDELDINVELAAPDQFIPPVAGWEARSIPVATIGEVAFLHYDPVGQALAKVERGHARDLADVGAMLERGLVTTAALTAGFESIRQALVRYPAVDARVFEEKVERFIRAIDAGPGGGLSDFDDLPGGDLIAAGLRDAARGVVSVPSLLVEIAAPRLVALGIVVPRSRGEGDAELRLYAELGRSGAADPYAEYNGLLRRLVSFTHALEQRRAASAR